MALTLASATKLLQEHYLLREIIQNDCWTLDPMRFDNATTPFTALTYDTRQVTEGSMLFCKGRFKTSYLDGIDEKGLAAYVAETDHSASTHAIGLIVNDVQKAMSLLSAEFYVRPQDALTVIGITGTKGKTTTAYFTHAILNAYTGGKAAMFSSVDNCIDGVHTQPAQLTTPESLDLFRMMRQAADAGMRYLVMEVSSQAYKVNRVYGLRFHVGAFLNISPDHISPIEHPTLEDYFYCKRQIVRHSDVLVLGAQCTHAELLREDAAKTGTPVVEFSLQEHADDDTARHDLVAAIPAAHDSKAFTLNNQGMDLGEFRLKMQGEFNYANAAAAVALAVQAGVPAENHAMHALESVQIPGRMEEVASHDGIIAYIDFAHNYLSVKALLDEIDKQYDGRDPYITVVTGSTGVKALDRREGIVSAARERVNEMIFTLDDPDTEDPQSIAEEMRSYVRNPNVATDIVFPREDAVAKAVANARQRPDRLNILLIIGKGNETRNKVNGRPVPYDGDKTVVLREFDRDRR